MEVTIEDIKKNESKLLPCPFCGKKFEIFITDGEGNLRDEDYLTDPWSGIAFDIYHDSHDCPIGFGYDTPVSAGYTSLKKLVKTMNKRH